MDIRSFYLHYIEKLKNEKKFNIWNEIFKNIMKRIGSFIIINIIGFLVFIAIRCHYKLDVSFSILLAILIFLIDFLIFLYIDMKNTQKKILESYEKFSKDRNNILFQLLEEFEIKDNNKIETLTLIKNGIEKLKEEANWFSYPVRNKSIIGYMILGSIILFGNFIISMTKFYFEKILEKNPNIKGLINILSIGFIVWIFIILILMFLYCIYTIYSFYLLRYYDYLINNLNNVIIFNNDFQAQSNQ